MHKDVILKSRHYLTVHWWKDVSECNLVYNYNNIDALKRTNIQGHPSCQMVARLKVEEMGWGNAHITEWEELMCKDDVKVVLPAQPCTIISACKS